MALSALHLPSRATSQDMSLSSLIVQRAIATIRQVEEALARQVLFGGDLPTNLLEVAVLDERRLTSVVAESFGLEAASPAQLAEPSPRAIAAVPSALAQRYLVAPLDITPAALIVACTEPLPEEARAALAAGAFATVEVRIALYPRVRELLLTAYGMPTDRRLDRLFARLGRTGAERAAQSPSAPPPATTLPRAATQPPSPSPSVPPFALSAAYGRSPVVTPSAPPVQVTEATLPYVVNPTVIVPIADDTVPQPPVMTDPPVTYPTPGAAPLARGAVPARTFVKPTSNPVRPSRRRRGPLTLELATEELEAALDRDTLLDLFFEFSKQFFDFSALFVVHGDLAEGRDAFGDGASRESVVGIGVPLELPSVLSAARDARGPLFTSLGFDGVDAVLAHDLERKPGLSVVLLPALVRTRTVALFFGDAGPAGVDRATVEPAVAFAQEVGRAFERLIVRKKLAVHTGAFPLTASTLDVPFGLPVRTASRPPPDPGAREEALGRALGLSKAPSASAPPPADEPAPDARQSQPPPVALAEPKRPSTPPIPRGDHEFGSPPRAEAVHVDASRLRRSTPPPSLDARSMSVEDVDRLLAEIAEAEGGMAELAPSRQVFIDEAAHDITSVQVASHALMPAHERTSHMTLPSVMVDVDREVATWVDTVAFGDDDGSAEETLVRLGSGAITAIMSRFPGPVSIDRAQLSTPLPKASACGNLLRVVVRLGSDAAAAIADAARGEDTSVRFWAMFVLAELPLTHAASAIVSCLSDADARVRMVARNAAAACAGVAHESLLAEIGKIMRDRESAPDAKLGVLDALGELNEVLGVPMLIRAISDKDEAIATVARRSLIAITRRDFQREDKQWLAWWGQNSSRHRVEWLIDALTDDAPPLRNSAAEDLFALTGERFGFAVDLPRRERERTQQLFRDWWAQQGRARFSTVTKTSRV